MSRPPLAVLKFGSSVIRSEADLPVVVTEIEACLQAGSRVVAVVSAIGSGTEALLARAGKLGCLPAAALKAAWSRPATPAPAPFAAGEAALAALLATGEATSAALLGLALDLAGVPSTVLDAGRVGPFTRGPQLDAEPCALDARAVLRALDARPVAVLPGFVGRDDDGNFSLLGRGGSDLSALFVARELGASGCRLLKDVDGIYEHDPAQAGPRPRRFATLSWEHALQLDETIVQRKAVQYAYRHRMPFEVGRCADRATVIGTPDSRFAPHARRSTSCRARREVITTPAARAKIAGTGSPGTLPPRTPGAVRVAVEGRAERGNRLAERRLAS